MTIPAGFEPHFRKSPLTAPWEPLYSKKTKENVVIGLTAAEQHCNSRGFVHGGLISAIADNAMGLSCSVHHKNLSGLVTISLHIDFVSSAQIGDWLEFETTYVKPGRTIDTVQGRVTSGGSVCATMSGIYKVIGPVVGAEE